LALSQSAHFRIFANRQRPVKTDMLVIPSAPDADTDRDCDYFSQRGEFFAVRFFSFLLPAGNPFSSGETGRLLTACMAHRFA